MIRLQMKIATYLQTRANKKLWSIRPKATLRDFAAELQKQCVGALTVLDDNGSLVGLMSERDLVKAFSEHGGASEDMIVADFMTRDVITCRPEDDMLATLEKMNACHIRHIPVMAAEEPSTMIGIREFDVACHELKELASTDLLTGVANRRNFLMNLQKEIERHRRIDAPLSVAVLELEWQEQDDGPGDDVSGDEMLIWFAQLLTKHFRTYDGVGRLGGGAFIVMFPNSNIHEAEVACERLGRIARSRRGQSVRDNHQITISQGVTSIHGYRAPCDAVLKVAEDLLAEAKAARRDCVVARSYLAVTDQGVSFSV